MNLFGNLFDLAEGDVDRVRNSLTLLDLIENSNSVLLLRSDFIARLVPKNYLSSNASCAL